jgi:hypothetical protein
VTVLLSCSASYVGSGSDAAMAVIIEVGRNRPLFHAKGIDEL